MEAKAIARILKRTNERANDHRVESHKWGFEKSESIFYVWNFICIYTD